MNKYIKYAITIALAALAVTCFILFELVHLQLVEDPITNTLLSRTIYHLALCALFIWLAIILNSIPYLTFRYTTVKGLLWCLPCLLVALVNFPYSGLITKAVSIDRLDLMGLYILYVISIAILEELVFRGILVFLLLDVFRRQRYNYFLAVLISSLAFSLFHFTNLFIGMDLVSVLLQVIYTFLIGAMLAVTVLKTKNVWLCVIIHAIFDFGGLLTGEIASGSPWDMTFWILTISCGILCAGHIIVSLINLERKHVS